MVGEAGFALSLVGRSFCSVLFCSFGGGRGGDALVLSFFSEREGGTEGVVGGCSCWSLYYVLYLHDVEGWRRCERALWAAGGRARAVSLYYVDITLAEEEEFCAKGRSFVRYRSKRRHSRAGPSVRPSLVSDEDAESLGDSRVDSRVVSSGSVFSFRSSLASGLRQRHLRVTRATATDSARRCRRASLALRFSSGSAGVFCGGAPFLLSSSSWGAPTRRGADDDAPGKRVMGFSRPEVPPWFFFFWSILSTSRKPSSSSSSSSR